MITRETIVDDFLNIEIQPMQAPESFKLSRGIAGAILEISHALTVLDAENKVLGIAGVTETRPGTAFVWVFLAASAGRHMLGLTRLLKRAMHENTRGYQFVETLVRTDFWPGHRWARMFGFECVQQRRSQDPDGNFEDLYRRAA